MIEIIISYAMEIVATLTILAIGIFGSWVLSKINTNKRLTNISKATSQVIAAAQQTVSELQQTTVETLKEAQDGKLTTEQVEDLKQKVLEITLKKLSSPTLNLLNSAKCDVISIITSAAEKEVLELKTL
jgi:2-oxoglutarate dehydrogenase complex dehydrogenase (E1) component-like enzyme